MICLMPYSSYEFEAMNRFLEQMANKGWQYCGRFFVRDAVSKAA